MTVRPQLIETAYVVKNLDCARCEWDGDADSVLTWDALMSLIVQT